MSSVATLGGESFLLNQRLVLMAREVLNNLPNIANGPVGAEMRGWHGVGNR
jgi:hypothetical protein